VSYRPLVAVVAYLFVYTRITPHNEFQLIRDNDPAAAIALGLSLLGFTLPVVSAIAHAGNIVDCLIWSAIARWEEERYTKSDSYRVEVKTPEWVARYLEGRAEWRFPILNGIVETPQFLADGRVLDTPGYDRSTRIMFRPRPSEVFPAIPLKPSRTDAILALSQLVEALNEFPFASKRGDKLLSSGEAAVVAAILSIVGRPAIKGQVPMFAIDAHSQESGKSTLARTIASIGTGRSAKVTLLPAMTTRCASVSSPSP